MDLELELFIEGRWRAAATVVLANPDAGFRGASTVSYGMGYFAEVGSEPYADGAQLGDARAVSVDIPVTLEDRRFSGWPAFLLDILPQGHQRERIAAQLKIDPNAASSDCRLLLQAGGSPVGNLRIRQARDEELKRNADLPRQGLQMEDILKRSDRFVAIVDAFSTIASGSSGLQGNSPKVAMTMASDGLWYPDSIVADADARQHVIAKFARGGSAADTAILAAEPGYLAIGAEFGLNVHAPRSTAMVSLSCRGSTVPWRSERSSVSVKKVSFRQPV